MRVLVVEDELRIATAIKRSLNAERFAVDIVTDGDSGLSYASSGEYDAIVMDRMIPGSIDGVGVCRQLRQEGRNTPVLLLTALGDIDDKLTGFENGADDYMVKPFSMQELIMRVKVLLRRPKSLVGPVVHIDDLEVNIETFAVKRGEAVITLTPREFKLLAYLARNKEKTVTKESIIRHTWDDDADITTNTVEVYIGSLRRKVDKAFPNRLPLIHTIHGFGYRLGAQ